MPCLRSFFKISSFYLLTCLAGGGLSASERQHATPLTLSEAIQLALEKEPDLRAAHHKVTAATGQAAQAGLWQNPELELTLDDWPFRQGGWSSSKRLAGVAQTVPFPGKKSLERRMGAASLKLSQAELAQRRVELVRHVKVAFYQALAAENLVRTGGELVQTAEVLETSARKRVEAGDAPEQEALRAQILLENARIELTDRQREAAKARKTLAGLLGRVGLGERPLSGILAEGANPRLLDGYSLAAHPLHKMAQEQLAHAGLALQRARLDAYPDITLGLAVGREAFTNATMGQIRAGIPLPLFDTSSGKRQEALGNLAIAEAQAEGVALRLSREWSVAAERVRSASRQARVFRERILPKVTAALRRVQAGFDEGKFGLTDVLETRRTAAETQMAYQRKLLELNVAQAELEALMGALR